MLYTVERETVYNYIIRTKVPYTYFQMTGFSVFLQCHGEGCDLRLASRQPEMYENHFLLSFEG